MTLDDYIVKRAASLPGGRAGTLTVTYTTTAMVGAVAVMVTEVDQPVVFFEQTDQGFARVSSSMPEEGK